MYLQSQRPRQHWTLQQPDDRPNRFSCSRHGTKNHLKLIRQQPSTPKVALIDRVADYFGVYTKQAEAKRAPTKGRIRGLDDNQGVKGDTPRHTIYETRAIKATFGVLSCAGHISVWLCSQCSHRLPGSPRSLRERVHLLHYVCPTSK